MKRLIKFIFSKKLLSFLFLFAQLVILATGFLRFGEHMAYLYWVQLLLCATVAIYEMNQQKNPAFQTSWMTLIALAPAFAVLLYLLVRTDYPSRRISRRLEHITKNTNRHLPQKPEVAVQLEQSSNRVGSMANYLREHCGYPTYQNTKITYFPSGELFFESIKEDLRHAKKFIFLEFFIIDHGIMWASILEILKAKVREGVEVRLMYDGMGSLYLLPRDYPEILKQDGILCRVFSPVLPLLSTAQNNRDHRKIVVIDGEIAYTGGINIGDEYINRLEKHGHWKDTAVRLAGDAVDSFSMMFLQMWNAAGRDERVHEQEYLSYLIGSTNRQAQEAEGFVIPFGDSPLDGEATGERVYLEMLSTAQHFVHITTPYLVPSSEMRETMKYTAKRGVEVVLLLPHIPDRYFMFALARTYYQELMRSGVKIYEYLPGFVHAKMSVADGKRAVVGTINHDFRSLYLHYECGVLLIDAPVIREIEQDFQEVLSLSHKVTMADYMKFNVFSRIFGYVLRLFAPLL